MSTRQERPRSPRTSADAGHGLKHAPGNLQWAAGWEQGNQFALNHPNDDDWLAGWETGWYQGMDERFPGWRTPVEEED